MPWNNLPCAPTLASLCPDGWVEVEYTHHAGNPTADPPQDADVTIGWRRMWGVEDSNLDEMRTAIAGLDLVEPPIGLPSRDLTMLVRVEAGAGPCNTCGRRRVDSKEGWQCSKVPDSEDWPDGACTGVFTYEVHAQTCWGPGNQPVYFDDGEPVYEG